MESTRRDIVYGEEDILAFAYDLMTEPVPGFEDYEGWRIRFEKSGFGAEGSWQAIELTLARMVKNGRVTYHNSVSGISLGEDLLFRINPSVNTWEDKVTEIKDSWQQYINYANE